MHAGKTGIAGIGLLIGALWLAGVSPATAEEALGLWRFEINFGTVVTNDEIESDSGNATSGVDIGGNPISVFDPRPDDDVTRAAELAPGPKIELRASYGFSEFRNGELILDMGIGYYYGRLKDLELSYALDQFDPNYIITITDPVNGDRVERVPGCESLPPAARREGFNCRFFLGDTGGDQFNQPFYERWQTETIDAATFQIYPVSVGATARFRPTKTFNPYLGAALGYMFVEQRASGRWKELQDELDASRVFYVDKVENSIDARQLKNYDDRSFLGRDVKRPNIDSPDTIFGQLRGGAEWQWKPKVALFFEGSFVWAADGITVTVDGKEKFGTPTPNGRFRDPSSRNAFPYGGKPAYIPIGGIRRTFRASNGSILGEGPWPGEYYVNGGRLDYGGYNFSVGVRFSL